MTSYSYQALGLDEGEGASGSAGASVATTLSSKSLALSFEDARSYSLGRAAAAADASTGESLLGGGLSDGGLRSKLRSDRASLGLGGSSENFYDPDTRKCRWDKPSRLVRMDRRTMCFRFTLLFLSVLIVFSGYFQFDLPAIIAQPYLYDKFSIAPAQFAVIFVGYSVSNTIVPLLSGPFFGKFGKWRGVTIIAATITVGICIVWMGVLMGGSAGYSVLVLGRAIYGLGGESVFVGVDILVTKWFQGAEIGFAYGLIQAAGQAGSFSALYSVPSLVKYWGADGPTYQGVNNCFLLSFILSCTAFVALGLARLIEKTAYGKKGAALGLKGMGDGHLAEHGAAAQHSGAGGAAMAAMDFAAQKAAAASSAAAGSAGAGAGKGKGETASLLRSAPVGAVDVGEVGGTEGEEEEEEEEDSEQESAETRARLERNLAWLKCLPPVYNAVLYLGFGHLSNLRWQFFAVMGGIIAYSSAFYTFLAWGPQWLQNNYDMDNKAAGQTAGIIAIFSMIISPSSGLLMDKYGGQRYICFAAMVSAFVWFTIMGFARVPPAVCIVFAGFSYSLLPASLYPLLPEVVAPEAFTIVYAVLNSAINLVFTVVLLVSGEVLGQDSTENLRRARALGVVGQLVQGLVGAGADGAGEGAAGVRLLQHGGEESKIDPQRFQYLFAIFMTITFMGSIATGSLAWEAYNDHKHKGWVPLANKH